MDIKDFQNNFKYKLILPFLYLTNWILMIIGPFFFPVGYQKYYFATISYLTFRSVMTFIWTVIGCYKANALLNQYQESTKPVSSQLSETKNENKVKLLETESQGKSEQKRNDNTFYHAFIIPNYNEDEWILQSTLQQIASHEKAQERIIVFLAMEAHQPKSDIKAKKLLKDFQYSFRLIKFTTHQMRQFQQKGKAANVSWCAQHIEEDFLIPNKIDPENVILTIIDADSWVPRLYLKQVDRYLRKDYRLRNRMIFQPCQMFTRNHMQVPALTRTYDMTHGLVHFSNLFSLFNTSFPLSNYSLSFHLAKQIGFWDTCPDAIGQDFHTTIKAFWKTKGQIRTISIFTPFNQLCIQTGKGYLTDMNKRFWQAERHGRGCADAAYCWKKIFTQGLNWRIFLIVYQVLEITTLPAVLPWCMIGSTGMSIYYNFVKPPAGMVDSIIIQWLMNTCTLSFIFSLCMNYYICRRASKLYYGLKNGNWIIRSVQYILWFIPNIFLVTVPSATYAAFNVAFGENVYEVAEKKAGRRR